MLCMMGNTLNKWKDIKLDEYEPEGSCLSLIINNNLQTNEVPCCNTLLLYGKWQCECSSKHNLHIYALYIIY